MKMPMSSSAAKKKRNLHMIAVFSGISRIKETTFINYAFLGCCIRLFHCCIKALIDRYVFVLFRQ